MIMRQTPLDIPDLKFLHTNIFIMLFTVTLMDIYNLYNKDRLADVGLGISANKLHLLCLPLHYISHDLSIANICTFYIHS